MRSHTSFISISVFALKTSVVQVVAANSSASRARLGTSLPSHSSSVNASAATRKKSCSEDRAVMDKPLVGSGCVEGSNAICNIRALSCMLERAAPRRSTFTFPQFRCTQADLGATERAMRGKPLVKRKCVNRFILATCALHCMLERARAAAIHGPLPTVQVH